MLHWRRDRTAFAISGGGARGAAQVGMLRALIERNITPDFVVGVSIGAWNGAWLAHRPDLGWVKKLEEVWRQVKRRTLDVTRCRARCACGRWVYVLDSGYAGRLPAPLGSMDAIVDHTFQIAAQHRTRWTIKQLGRAVEIIHLRPDAGFLRHSMDFSATDFYLHEGYRFACEILDTRRKRRPLPELAPVAAPVYH